MTIFELEFKRMKDAIDRGMSNYLTASDSYGINQNEESKRLPKSEYRDIEIRYDVDGDNSDGLNDNTLKYTSSFIAGRVKWNTEEELMTLLAFDNKTVDEFHHIMDNSYMIVVQLVNSVNGFKMHIKYLLSNNSEYVLSQQASRLVYTAVYDKNDNSVEVTMEDNPFTFGEAYRETLERLLKSSII